MKKLPLICASFAFLCLSAVANASPLEPAEFASQEFTFTKILCPASCSKLIQSSLQPFLGSKLEIGPNQFSGPMLDSLFASCEGKLEVKLSTQTRQEKINELKKAVAPRHKFAAASLHLPEPVVSALVLCVRDRDGKAGNIARIVSIEKDRLLLLFEYQTILELRKPS